MTICTEKEVFSYLNNKCQYWRFLIFCSNASYGAVSYEKQRVFFKIYKEMVKIRVTVITSARKASEVFI